MCFKEIRWEGKDRIQMAQDWDQEPALVNTVMDLCGSIKGGNFLD
jgi:hypothetical protein